MSQTPVLKCWSPGCGKSGVDYRKLIDRIEIVRKINEDVFLKFRDRNREEQQSQFRHSVFETRVRTCDRLEVNSGK